MITIVIASYNHVKYIRECLSSVVKVKLAGKKIVVIDDGSTDGTIDVIKEFITADNNQNDIQFIAKANSGLVSSLNMGLEIAATPYFYLTASDDIPVAEGIETMVRIMEDDAQKDFIIGGASNFFENGLVVPTYNERHQKFFSLAPAKLHDALFCSYPHPILLQSTVFRTNFLKTLGGWDTDLVLDDYPMFIKIFSYCINNNKQITFKPEVKCTNYRHHTNNSYKNTFKQFNMVYSTIVKYTPPSLLNKAKGEVFSYYLVQALKNKDSKSIYKMGQKLNVGASFYTVLSGFKKALKR